MEFVCSQAQGVSIPLSSESGFGAETTEHWTSRRMDTATE